MGSGARDQKVALIRRPRLHSIHFRAQKILASHLRRSWARRAARPDAGHEQELRGEELFYGKAQCGDCHTGSFYTDNSMHDLAVERFYDERLVNGRLASADGPIKTFTLRGIKDSPPYLHDGRLLTLEDTVEFFNLVLGVQLTEDEKADLLAFLYAL